VKNRSVPGVRPQTTLRLSQQEIALLDAAARRLHLDRASLIRAAALSVAELVCDAARPLVLAVEPAALLRRVADRVGGGSR
jgi:uncharacterized protein (DUF1778 family)